MYDRFTSSAQMVIKLSRKEATRLRHDSIGTAHILLGLVLEGSTIGTDGPSSCLKIQRVREAMEKHVSPGATVMMQLPFTPRAKYVFQLAMEDVLPPGSLTKTIPVCRCRYSA